jgi:hypothetical protein
MYPCEEDTPDQREIDQLKNIAASNDTKERKDELNPSN